MRIKELRVHRYGPLADVQLPDLGDFTLIFGENESGKTLLLDAILRFLLPGKRERQLFPQLDRVEHDPDGFIDILHGDKVFRFPDEGSLADLLGIHASDLRNVFVVRASDLHIEERGDGAYYDEITDRLVGIHRESLSRIKKQLLNIGRLTPSGKLSNAQGQDKIASKLKAAKGLIANIETINQQVADIDLVALEAKLLEAEERKDELEREFELLHQAKNRQEYEEGTRSLQHMEDCIRQIEALPAIEQEHYDAWRDVEKTIQDASQDLQDAENDLAKSEGELESAEERLREAEDHLHVLQRQEPEMEDLKRRAEEHGQRMVAASKRSSLVGQLPRILMLLALLTSLAFLGIIVGPQRTFLEIAAVILGVFFAISAIGLLIHQAREGRLRGEWKKLRMDAATAGIEADDLEILLKAIGSFEHELSRAQEQRNEAEANKRTAAIRLQDRKDQIKKLRKKVESAQSSLQELRNQLGLTSFADLEKARGKLETLQIEQERALASLAAKFGEQDGPIDEKIKAWHAIIQELAKYADAAPDTIYDEALEKALTEELQRLKNEIDAIQGQLAELRGKIAEIASETSRILSTEEQLPGETLEDLAACEQALRTFVQEVEETAGLAWKAHEILSIIEEEEQQKVQDLFGGDDVASEYFRYITDGAYDRVMYDARTHELSVIRPNGEALRAYNLSSGTYDQLYLATRLSLASRLLEGEKGFLLLDDPFLTSDAHRLPRQLNILLDLVNRSWQIIYFSVKFEVLEVLKKAIEKGFANLVELEPLA